MLPRKNAKEEGGEGPAVSAQEQMVPFSVFAQF
jgi:hypothetical protein